MKIHLTQYLRNINKIYDLNFPVIFILKKIIILKNIYEINKFKQINAEGSYSFDWTHK